MSGTRDPDKDPSEGRGGAAPGRLGTRDARFLTTRWSVVLDLREGDERTASEALSTLCRAYWRPLYAYARGRGKSPADAEDLTQGFFAMVLQKDFFRHARREKGKLRTFLLTAMQRFMVNEWERESAQKRGGGASFIPVGESGEDDFAHEPADDESPEDLFERRWALAVLENTLRDLEEDYASRGKAAMFEALKGHIGWYEGSSKYSEVAERLGMGVPAVKVAVFRMRKRFRDALWAQVAGTVDDPGEVEEELNHIIAVLRG